MKAELGYYRYRCFKKDFKGKKWRYVSRIHSKIIEIVPITDFGFNYREIIDLETRERGDKKIRHWGCPEEFFKKHFKKLPQKEVLPYLI